MTATVTKAVAFAVTGPTAGIAVTKVVAYIVLEPGTEVGATPPVQHANTYAQILDKPNPVGAQ